MIILITPHADSMYDPSGAETAFEQMRTKVRVIAKTLSKIPKTSDFRVLLISSEGDESAAESVARRENPLTVRLPRIKSECAVGSVERAVEVTSNLGRAVGAFCHVEGDRKHVVFVDDADFYFYPQSERGEFTRTLDNDVELMNHIGAIGECLSGYYGHLVLIAALSQNPNRLLTFVDTYGWSWIRHHAGKLERMHGTLPQVLEDYCSDRREVVLSSGWSPPMTIKEIADYTGLHRNTVGTRIRNGQMAVQTDGTKYRIRLSDLSDQAREKLLERERRSLDSAL